MLAVKRKLFISSYIEQLDPRSKIIFTLIASFTIVITNKIGVLSLVMVILLLLSIMSKFNFSLMLKKLLLVNSMVALLWIVLPLTMPGTILLKFFSLNIYLEGIKHAFLITLKTNTIVLLSTIFIANTSSTVLGQALLKLKISSKLVNLLFFITRYLEIIKDETEKVIMAAKVRGFIPKINLHTYRTYAYILAISIIKSWDRSDQIYQAMLCRGFNGSFYNAIDFSFKKQDIIFLIITISILAMALGLNFHGQ